MSDHTERGIHADRDHSEEPYLSALRDIGEAWVRANPHAGAPYWPTGTVQRARTAAQEATGHTETGEALRGAQERFWDASDRALREATERAEKAEAKVAQYERDLNIQGDEFDIADLRAEIERLTEAIYRQEAAIDRARMERAQAEDAETAAAERADRLAGVVERVRALAEAAIDCQDCAVASDVLAILDADAPVANGHYREVWTDALPPGGFVRAACGTPVETEPCPEHAPEASEEGHRG